MSAVIPGPFVRPAVNEDGPALARLVAGVFAEYPGCVYEPAEFPELDAIADYFAERGGRMWVIESSSTLIGSLAVAPSYRPDAMELYKVYLAHRHRGRGLAGSLLQLANDFAAANGARSLFLWTDTRFVLGHRFYERNGFRRLPGLRALHDASNSLEYFYRRDITS
jgi:putative acetyltransferase